MKKICKQLTTLALAMMLLVSLCIPALATSTPSKGADGNPVAQVPVASGSTATVVVGVSSPDEAAANGGDTLLAYQVVKITYNENNSLTYGFTDTFTAFQAGTEWAALTPESYGELSEDALKPLLGAFTAYIKGQDPKPQAYKESTASGDGVATFTGMDMGQYIIVGDGSSTGAKIYQTVTAEVRPEVVDNAYMLYSSYDVAMKTSKPSVSKSITEGTVTDDKITTGNLGAGDKHDKHQQTAAIGDIVTYTVTVNVPTYPDGATNKTFFIGDTLSKGLTLEDVAVAGNFIVTGYETEDAAAGTTLTAPTDYYVSSAEQKDADGNTTGTALYADFIFDQIAKFHHVTITYKAALNEFASLGTTTGNPNDVDLIYSNSPFDGSSWKPGTPGEPDEPDRPQPGKPGTGVDEDKEIVYTYALVIDKFEEKHEDNKLLGAEFDVYKGPMGEGNEKIATITTDSNGAAILKGLEQGTFYLYETKAPSGFNPMAEPLVITIDADSIPYSVEEKTSVTHYTYTADDNGNGQAKLNGNLVWINAETGEVQTGATAPEGYVAAYQSGEKTTVTESIKIDKDVEGANGYYKAGVANATGAQLPSTGGIGTTIFYVVGGVLVLAAAILLVTKRRMNNTQD